MLAYTDILLHPNKTGEDSKAVMHIPADLVKIQDHAIGVFRFIRHSLAEWFEGDSPQGHFQNEKANIFEYEWSSEDKQNANSD